MSLVPQPRQPNAIPWPSAQWPRATLEPALQREVEQHAHEIFELSPAQGVTYALLVVKSGRMVYERYAAGASAMYLQYSWSMAKSVVHALAGILVRDGRLDVHAPADVPEWQSAGDPRRAITLDQQAGHAKVSRAQMGTARTGPAADVRPTPNRGLSLSDTPPRIP